MIFNDTPTQMEVARFVELAGESLKSFRYFNKRPLSVIENHACTVLVMENQDPIGYGHLDREGDDVWLGICIRDNLVSKGLGTRIMKYLLFKARTLNLKTIKLTVDKDNKRGQALYVKFGFKIDREAETHCFMSRQVLDSDLVLNL